MNNKTCALILGGHVNGYSIIKELYQHNIRELYLVDYGKSLSQYSNKCKYLGAIKSDRSIELLTVIKSLRMDYGLIVIYPTDDRQLELLVEISKEIECFTYIPCKPEVLSLESDKSYQYSICAHNKIPCPRSVTIYDVKDIENINRLTYPLLIKPVTRSDRVENVFRNIYLDTKDELSANLSVIYSVLDSGVELLVSEYVPGDDTNIFAYTCFKTSDGRILGEWTGKKLTQYPDNYGVVSSASNEASSAVLELGRRLCERLDSHGILEPEFKFDYRDGLYKLMEVNLRSMMWNHVGHCSGVSLHAQQYKYATGEKALRYSQVKDKKIHWVLMLHEIPNLINRRGYWKHLKNNLFNCDIRKFAIFSLSDPAPFLASCLILLKVLVKMCSKS